MSGFTVDEAELRTYADKLAGTKDKAAAIAGLVDKSDVGDESWGVVGLFVKSEYTETLADLNELFTALQEGLQAASDKFTQAADGYRRHEEAVQQLLANLKFEIDA